MAKILHETEIECSNKLFNPFFGNDRAKLIIHDGRLVFKKINTKMRIPQTILISNIKSVKLKLIWKLQLIIEILYKSKGKVEKLSFVSGGIVDKIAYQSMPFKTYKVYKVIKNSLHRKKSV